MKHATQKKSRWIVVVPANHMNRAARRHMERDLAGHQHKGIAKGVRHLLTSCGGSGVNVIPGERREAKRLRDALSAASVRRQPSAFRKVA